MRLYKNRVFAAASFTTFGLGAALFGAMILVPLYYQEVRGQSVILTGLLVGPQGLGMLIAMPIAGRLTDRFGGGRVALVGVSILTLGTIPLAFVGVGSSILGISVILALRGIGIGFLHAGDDGRVRLAAADQLSDATPQLNVLQRLGGAIGTAVLAVVLQRASGHAPSVKLAGAFDAAYWWSLGIAALGADPVRGAVAGREPRGQARTIARKRGRRPPAGAESSADPVGV